MLFPLKDLSTLAFLEMPAAAMYTHGKFSLLY